MSFVVERYFVARRIWHTRSLKAHDGFPATDTRPAVPAQTWAEWFEWAYGMPLEEYSKIAQEHGHADVVKSLGPSPLFDYKLPGRNWLTLLAAPGDTLETVTKFLRGYYPDLEEVRPRP